MSSELLGALHNQQRINDMKLFRSLYLLTACCLIISPTGAFAGDTIVEEKKGATCRKTNTGGCTAKGDVCFSAPSGKFIEAASLGKGVVKSHWKKNPICETARPTSFVYVTPKGFPAAVPLPVQACLFSQAESGSGGGDFGKVAFVNCELTFVVHEIPKE